MSDTIDAGKSVLCTLCGGRHCVPSASYSQYYDGYKKDCPRCAGTGKLWKWHDASLNKPEHNLEMRK